MTVVILVVVVVVIVIFVAVFCYRLVAIAVLVAHAFPHLSCGEFRFLVVSRGSLSSTMRSVSSWMVSDRAATLKICPFYTQLASFCIAL
ncbi:hypothetical protein B0H14DRAFT_2835034, partial [Mycena olivaceomarginata]